MHRQSGVLRGPHPYKPLYQDHVGQAASQSQPDNMSLWGICRDAANGSNAAAGKDDAGGLETPANQKPAPGRKKARESVDVARPITDFFSK